MHYRRDDRPSKAVIAVVIATYLRPVRLRQLLQSILDQDWCGPFLTIVVDNDPNGSAQAVVKDVMPAATYEIESTPGIAACRNLGISLALSGQPDFLAFIDDDEVAQPDWLSALFSTIRDSGADASTGKVVYVVPADTPIHIRKVGYFQTVDRAEGSLVKYVATNNTLVDARWFRGAVGYRFNEDFSMSGGSDLELFLRMQRAGAVLVWSSSAVVRTLVPRERLRREWIHKREVRNGQLIARLNRRFEGMSRIQVVRIGMSLILLGGYGGAKSWKRDLDEWILSSLQVMAGIGWLRAASGVLYLEYSRIHQIVMPEMREPDRCGEDRRRPQCEGRAE